MTLLYEKEFNLGFFKVYDQMPTQEIIQLKQTHSNIIEIYNGKNLSSIEADGIIIDPNKNQGKTIAIKTADCLPVLFMGEKIALVHAGWMGLKNNILKDRQIIDAKIHTILIGPSIQNYEVQENFKEEFPQSPYFYREKSKLFFDLQKEAISQLNVNYPYVKVYNTEICTLKNTAYNSYRRDKTIKRNWNIFQIK